jgi:hypothetical protein
VRAFVFVVTRLIPGAMRERFAAADSRYDAVTRAAHVFSREESRIERTRTAVHLARWRQHIESCKWEAIELWFAGGFTAPAVVRAFDDAMAAGVAVPSPAHAQ